MNKLILGAATVALMAASSANASFILYMDDLSTVGTDVIVQDDTLIGALTSIGFTTDGDANVIDGVVQYTGSLNNFLVSAAIGTSDPVNVAPGTIFDLFSLTIGGAGDMVIGLTDTDFTGDQNFTFHIGGTTDGSVSAQAYLDLGNVEFGQGTLLGDMSTSGTGAFAYSSATSYLDNLVNPYSLSLVTTVHHQGSDVT